MVALGVIDHFPPCSADPPTVLCTRQFDEGEARLDPLAIRVRHQAAVKSTSKLWRVPMIFTSPTDFHYARAGTSGLCPSPPLCTWGHTWSQALRHRRRAAQVAPSLVVESWELFRSNIVELRAARDSTRPRMETLGATSVGGCPRSNGCRQHGSARRGRVRHERLPHSHDSTRSRRRAAPRTPAPRGAPLDTTIS